MSAPYQKKLGESVQNIPDWSNIISKKAYYCQTINHLCFVECHAAA